MTLLDIGGGFGSIQHELIKNGVASAVGVEASTTYVRAAKEEAERQGHADRITTRHGNFVEMAPQVEPADIVTLDKVICCYHDMEGLLGAAAEHTTKMLGVVSPKDNVVSRFIVAAPNLLMRLRRHPFRVFIHRDAAVKAVVEGAGLTLRARKATFIWQVAVYGR